MVWVIVFFKVVGEDTLIFMIREATQTVTHILCLITEVLRELYGGFLALTVRLRDRSARR